MAERTGVHATLEEHLEVLGTVPDHVVAEKTGLSVSAVGRFRRARGIAAYQGFKFGQREGGAPLPRRSSRLEAFRELLGVLPDREVAQLAGLTPEGVRIYRKRKGIPKRPAGGELAHLSPPRSQPMGSVGYEVALRTPRGPECIVLLADDLVQASRKAETCARARSAQVERVAYVGPVLTFTEPLRHRGHG